MKVALQFLESHSAKFWKRTQIAILVTTAALACDSRRTDMGVHLNADLMAAETRSCGMVVTLGEGISSGADHERPLQFQAVVCGDDGIDPQNQWHAIGAGAERQEVFVQQGSKQSFLARAVVKGGREVELLNPSTGLRIPLGSVEEDAYYFPVKLQAGVSAELRHQGTLVPLAELKSVAADELELWIVIGG